MQGMGNYPVEKTQKWQNVARFFVLKLGLVLLFGALCELCLP